MKHFILGSRYYFTRLTDFEKKVYRKIYDSWCTGGSVAELDLPGSDFTLPSGLRLHRLVNYIVDENPHLFHLESTHFHYTRLGTRVTIETKSVYTPEEYEAVYRKLFARVDQLVEQAARYGSEYERFRFLHDYLVENVTYDYGAPDPKSQREVHTIVGCLLNSACVCDGYARAYRLLCDQLHLSCIVVIGDSIAKDNPGPHAWNAVKLNGQVYHVDVTWDSNTFAAGHPLTDYYFLRSDRVFSEKHAWDPVLYPPITEDYPRKNPLISDKWELEKYLCGRIQAGERDILIELADTFPDAETLWRLLNEIEQRNPRVFRGIRRDRSLYYPDKTCAMLHFR